MDMRIDPPSYGADLKDKDGADVKYLTPCNTQRVMSLRIGHLSPEKVYRFISDPGHGWLEVPLSDYESSGYKASSFSYVNSTHIYLEEDCDAAGYLRAAGLLGADGRINPELCAERFVDLDHKCFVRRLDRHSGAGYRSRQRKKKEPQGRGAQGVGTHGSKSLFSSSTEHTFGRTAELAWIK